MENVPWHADVKAFSRALALKSNGEYDGGMCLPEDLLIVRITWMPHLHGLFMVQRKVDLICISLDTRRSVITNQTSDDQVKRMVIAIMMESDLKLSDDLLESIIDNVSTT
ncbi:uncharacterized protein Pyn_27191 [Prunus yedoensis var. nudiflora]|uniref:Uncharacterized protein n=1 Tax=Prunus yedoensis var. nudiflora TaxID=2094558 RepID=A0A314YTB6_PRUYE|nr:uncharacterized protein Pyn_27191 [Prunus yedoensis var. nudiflora]